MIAARVKGAKPAKPKLRIIQAAKPTIFDSITRECILKRVRYLAKAYQLHWVIDQATFNMAGVDSLEDRELSKLMSEMERARECVHEGVAFDDAGLVRSNADDMPDYESWGT